MMLSAVLFIIGLFWKAKAADEYPYAANQTCPGKAWLADASQFRFSNGPNAPVKPQRTFISGYDFPYIVRLQEKLQIGQTVYFRGKFPSDATRTQFYFFSRTNGELRFDVGAIPFHISVRFVVNQTVLNTAKDGVYGVEQILENPFHPNDTFEIHVRVMDSFFEVYFNKVWVASYNYRMPFDIVDHIRVHEDVEIDELRVVGRYMTTPFSTELNGNHLNLYDHILIDANSWPLKAGLRGLVFDIKLLNGKDDILFLFSVQHDRGAVVRNSLIDGKWGTEETDGGFPFSKGVSFQLEIVNNDDSLRIIVDGKDFTSFKHRMANPNVAYRKIEFAQKFLPAGLEVCQFY